MSGFSGIEGKAVERKKGPRFMINWRARFFLKDKKIHPATLISIYNGGFGMLYSGALPVGAEMNLEFAFLYREQPQRVRVKARVDYCLIRSNSEGVDVDLALTKIGREDQHMLANVLQELSESKEFDLRL